MRYIDRAVTTRALVKLAKFHEETCQLFSRYDMNLLSDLGRRNTLLSSAQEKFFTDELRAAGFEVQGDGRPGQPDIVIVNPEDSSKIEIECKLTTRNSQGGIILQTDYTTLQRKGFLDYLYVIADVEFRKFAVLYFHRLTTDNFRVPSNGSRGKAAMLKHTCYDRCTVLHGGYHSLGSRHIRNITAEMDRASIKKLARLQKKLDYWQNSHDRFEVELEDIRFDLILT